MRRTIYLSIIAVFFTIIASAQIFKLSSEIRPRFENRHGVKTFLKPGEEGASFISQRTRLNLSLIHI